MLLFAMGTRRRRSPCATRHVRKEVLAAKRRSLNRCTATQSLSLDIALPLRNESELDDLLQELYDPQSTSFHQFLSVQEFTERFGSQREDYAAVVRFAEQHGLKVTGTSPNRMVLNVAGSVANVERCLPGDACLPISTRPKTAHSMRRTGSHRRTFRCSCGIFRAWIIFRFPQPASLSKAPEATHHATGSGPNGYYIGSDMRGAYYGGSALTGAGQSVGLLEFAGYNLADVDDYFASVGQTRKVAVNGISHRWLQPELHGELRRYRTGLGHRSGDLHGAGDEPGARLRLQHQRCKHLQQDGYGQYFQVIELLLGLESGGPSQRRPYLQGVRGPGPDSVRGIGRQRCIREVRNVYPADDAYVTSVGGTDLTTSSAGRFMDVGICMELQQRRDLSQRHRDSQLPEDDGSYHQGQQRLQDFAECPRCRRRSEHGQLHLFRRNLRGRVGWNQFCGASMGWLPGVGQSAVCRQRQVDPRLSQPNALRNGTREELFHRLP